jgi:histidyl-tRNA synthetase
MALSLLNRLEVKGIGVLVNSVGCRKCRPSFLQELKQKAQEARESLCNDCQRKIETNPLRIFDCKIEVCKETSQDFPKITDHLCPECKEHFDQFCSHLDQFEISFKIEPRLVRGIDYYTKTTFEIVSSDLGAQDAILGGGRYDDMMKDFGGPDICGIGFAMGMERLLSVVPFDAGQERFVYIAYLGNDAKCEGMKVARLLRRENVECLIEYKEKTLKNLMSRANKLGASWVLIIGEDEVKKGKFQIKNMESGTQEEGSSADILKIIKGKESN